MTALQERASRLVANIPDQDLTHLMWLLLRFAPDEAKLEETDSDNVEKRRKAFHELIEISGEISKRLPDAFDWKEEYLEALDEKYRCTN